VALLDLNANIENARRNLICLQYTRTITKEDLHLPEWIEFKAGYDKFQDANTAVQAHISALNAIIYQRRMVFCVTRKGLQELRRSDKNWEKRTAFRHEQYREVLRLLFEYVELVKVPKKLNPRSLLVLRVTKKSILDYLASDHAKQLEETLAFIQSAKEVK
jgi:hypothetical protein